MASPLHLSAALLLLLLLLRQGVMAGGRELKCGRESIVITQEKTGKVVEGKPEYEVTVLNSCRCTQTKVVARCYGLSSVEPVDLRVIKPVDSSDYCIINGGLPVGGGSAVKFRYAWMTPQDFPIVSSQIHC